MKLNVLLLRGFLVAVLLIGLAILLAPFVKLAFCGEGFDNRVAGGFMICLFGGLGYVAVLDFMRHLRRPGAPSSGEPPLEPALVPKPSGGKPPALSAAAYVIREDTL